jgi:hypothetical protein
MHQIQKSAGARRQTNDGRHSAEDQPTVIDAGARRLRMSWRTLEDEEPALAAFGAERLDGKVAYLATVRRDGSPRVHPMTPIIGGGHFFVFMEQTSPKGHDLERDGRYAIHCAVTDTSGVSGECFITGRAHLVDDPALRLLAVKHSSYTPADRYVLFEFDIESAASTTYSDGKPIRRTWKRGER